MPLVYSAIVPHPPVLLPSIGKANLGKLKSTSNAFKKISAKLVEHRIDTIIITTPHGLIQGGSFSINFSPELTCDFRDFGDLGTKKKWYLDIELAYRIKESLEDRLPLQLTTNPILDHGASVPLILLTEKLAHAKIIPIHYSDLGLREHFEFGVSLKKQIANSTKKIAVISSGDLSHCATKNSPIGYSPKGKKFDKKLIELLAAGNTEEITNMDPALVEGAKECGLRSILIQQGLLSEVNCSRKMLSYEHPFGIGYLVMEFEPIR